MDLTKEDLVRMLEFIENKASIIIHFGFAKSIEFFLKDNHYRNMFEVGTGGGSLSR
jgi:hypothetical protein